MKTTEKTPFEVSIEKSENLPQVNYEGKEIPYFKYQLAVHHFNLKLMARGMKFNGIKFTDIKTYYGLKGRSAKDCLPEFERIMNDYLK